MAYMLRRRILTDSDLDDNTTWKKDLPNTGMITAFEVAIQDVRETSRDGANTCHPLVEVTTLLELIAESTQKVFSVTGRQADFLNYLDFKRITSRKHWEKDGDYNNLSLFILGGRSLYDTEYGFDMAKLKNAFLNYTYNHQEGTDYYFEAGKHSVDVYVWQWMGPGAPKFKGYFKTRQTLAYQTTGTDVIFPHPITPGLPLRRVIVQAKDVDETIGGTWSRIELEVGGGEYSPVVITNPFNWVRHQVSDYGLDNVSRGHLYDASAGFDMYLPNEWGYYVSGQASDYGVIAQSDAINFQGLTKPIRLRTGVAGSQLGWEVRGVGYQGCLLIGFDHLPDEAEALITRGMGSLNLLLTEVESGNTGAVVIQEIEHY